VYSGWVHLKVIRAFTESVLRYGLPVSISSMFIEPNLKREKILRSTLSKTISKMSPHLTQAALAEDEEEDEDTENLPYVCHKFNVIGASLIA
jgi:V-type H+-transporting ATPase subunit C